MELLGQDNEELHWSRSLVAGAFARSEEHTSELQSQSNLVCRLLLGKQHGDIWSLFFYGSGDHGDLPSCPTRRSSDLAQPGQRASLTEDSTARGPGRRRRMRRPRVSGSNGAPRPGQRGTPLEPLTRGRRIRQIGRAHVRTPVTVKSRMPSSAWKTTRRHLVSFFLRIRRPRRSPLLPYTTLFRSGPSRSASQPNGGLDSPWTRAKTANAPATSERLQWSSSARTTRNSIGAAHSWPAHSPDRKSTRPNSSHSQISYAVFCLENNTATSGLFFFTDPATTEISPLALHDALPIWPIPVSEPA